VARPSEDLAAEYEVLRSGVGAHLLARDVLWLHGPDAERYLQGQCSQDVARLAPGEAADALLLAPDGKLDALIRVTRCLPDGFVIDTEGGFGEAVMTRLTRFALRTRIELDQLEWSCVALRGSAVPVPDGAAVPVSGGAAVPVPGGAAVPVPGGAPGDGNRVGADAGGDGRGGADVTGPAAPAPLRVDWNGWRGVDLLAPDPGSLVPDGARWCGTAAWEACRVESGIPVMGRELDHRTIAVEAGLVERTVSFTKGCYTGQELVARLDARGNRVARRLCAVVPGPDGLPDPADLEGAVLVAPDAGATPGKPLGSVTSAAWCPGIGAPAGIAYAHRSLAVPGPVALLPAGSPSSPVLASLAELPLV
jgi:folate-binding protein YgfZ